MAKYRYRPVRPAPYRPARVAPGTVVTPSLDGSDYLPIEMFTAYANAMNTRVLDLERRMALADGNIQAQRIAIIDLQLTVNNMLDDQITVFGIPFALFPGIGRLSSLQ